VAERAVAAPHPALPRITLPGYTDHNNVTLLLIAIMYASISKYYKFPIKNLLRSISKL